MILVIDVVNYFIVKVNVVYRYLLLLLGVLVFVITFETAQQLYYLKAFHINDDARFLELLKYQAYRWVIWFMFTGFIFAYFYKKKKDHEITLFNVLRIAGLILGLVILNILIISTVAMLENGVEFSLNSFFAEYVVFFIYQKAAMYFLGYVAISIIAYLYLANEKLQIKVHNLFELKLTNERLYNELKSKFDDKASVLSIKIGDKRKIINTKDILWIEADDYCVRVHTISHGAYTMRSSLKALDEKLKDNFLRVHRKALVNMNFARELHMNGQPSLVLENDFQIPVSKSNLKLVREFLT